MHVARYSRAFCASIFAAVLLLAFAAPDAAAQSEHPKVTLQTTMGNITIELFPDKAPKSAANFLQYVHNGFYDGTIFHRVIDGFMIQGGGLDQDVRRKPTRAPIPNEANNGLRNTAYSVAMARTSAPHSATSQFFINLKDNAFLDFRSPTAAGYGYAVFGRVVQGQNVVDRIAKVDTGKLGARQNVPVQPVIIRKAVAAP
jgi:cyclophilin family peptidyl-prolyl cis-trans isomerase